MASSRHRMYEVACQRMIWTEQWASHRSFERDLQPAWNRMRSNTLLWPVREDHVYQQRHRSGKRKRRLCGQRRYQPCLPRMHWSFHLVPKLPNLGPEQLLSFSYFVCRRAWCVASNTGESKADVNGRSVRAKDCAEAYNTNMLSRALCGDITLRTRLLLANTVESDRKRVEWLPSVM